MNNEFILKRESRKFQEKWTILLFLDCRSLQAAEDGRLEQNHSGSRETKQN